MDTPSFKRIVNLPVGRSVDAIQLTRDQRSMFIILEDAVLRFLRDELQLLLYLKEVKEDGLAKVAVLECMDVVDHRVREIRRGWPHEKAEQYEEDLLVAVDACDPERQRIHNEIRSAMVQKVEYQHIQRAEHIAVAGGLVYNAQQIHYKLTGKKHKYDLIHENLTYLDKRLVSWLLNPNAELSWEDSRKAFGNLFIRLTDAVLDKFTFPAGQEDAAIS